MMMMKSAIKIKKNITKMTTKRTRRISISSALETENLLLRTYLLIIRVHLSREEPHVQSVFL